MEESFCCFNKGKIHLTFCLTSVKSQLELQKLTINQGSLA